ncbi:MAG: M20 family peptidase [Arenibacterium sp.]
MNWVKRIAAVVGLGLVALATVLLINTLRYKPPPIPDTKAADISVDVEAAAALLSRAITFKTMSTQPDNGDFDGFLSFLVDVYPQVHQVMTRQMLDQKTPLYTWQGSDAAARPILLAAHYDVVPIAFDSLNDWVHPPFSGTIDQDFVWGRGTLDNKGALIAMLSVVEQMIAEGFQPERTIYFSFGGDEEVGGDGAASVAAYLTEQGVRLDWALDEGSFVLQDIVPGLDVPVASINLSEKGYVTLSLTAKGAGGHSSMPPRETAVGQLAKAVARVQDNPMPGGLDGVSESFFDALGRHFSFGQRLVFANRWLFEPLLEGILSAAPSTDAMLRTTTAPTMLSGSPKENVLATQARAAINFRIHPRDTVDGIIEHVRRVVDDPGIEIDIIGGLQSEASPVAGNDTDGYRDIEAAIRGAFGPIASVPGLTIAATDARHYAKAADHAYRINPFRITEDDLNRFHGLNERLSLENLERGMIFYRLLLERQ